MLKLRLNRANKKDAVKHILVNPKNIIWIEPGEIEGTSVIHMIERTPATVENSFESLVEYTEALDVQFYVDMDASREERFSMVSSIFPLTTA